MIKLLLLQKKKLILINIMVNRFNAIDFSQYGLPLALALIFFASPILWLGDLYFAGGDNSQLYYLMPRSMMGNYLFNIVGDNGLGILGTFRQESYQAPFFGLLFFFKSILPKAINIQALSFGINLSLSFLGFYWLLGLLINDDKGGVSERLIRAISGIAYCSSLFIVSTMWKHALYAVYLTSIFPLVLYLFLRGVREQSLRYVVVAGLLASLFSIVLMAVPWLVGTLLIILPLLIWHQIAYPKTLRYLLYFGIILVGLNAFWLGTMVYSMISPDNLYSVLSTPEANDGTILNVTSQNNIAYPVLGAAMPRWVEEIDKVWLGSLPTTSIFTFIIIAAGIFVKKTRHFLGLYYAGVACWILAIYFYTVRIDNWGVDLFIALNHSVPGFTMFRNNFDKFSIGIAFCFAFLVAISTNILIKQPFWQNHVIALRSLLGTLFFLVILQALPFLRESLYDKPLWTTKSTYTTISSFNNDFNALVAHLQQESGDSKYLWLPLNSAGYVQIADVKLPGHYYSGPSPLRFLADKSDFTGRFSFGSQAVGDKLFNNILEYNYDEVLALFKTMNIGYVIVNNDLSRDIINSYLYGMHGPGDLYNLQMNLIKPFVLGTHVRDFGSRYSLYKIKPDLYLSKIHLKDTAMGRGKVEWRKVSSSEYTVKLGGLDGLALMVLLEPYHGEWELTTASGKKLVPPLAQHSRIYGYANSWQLNLADLEASLPQSDYGRAPDGSLTLEIKLEFAPTRWTPYTFMISGMALAACLLYLATGLMRRRRAA